MSCVGLSPSRLMPAMLLASLVLVGVKTQAYSQEHTSDAHTLLLLHCNGNLDGAQGESPVQASGISFGPGIFGGAAHFGAANEVHFAGTGNISSMEGTLEFWIKPAWNGEDGQTHVVLLFGRDEGGMVFLKDGADNWRSILNRFAGESEIGTSINISAWQAGEWHHCAFTWSPREIRLYINGELLDSRPVTVSLPLIGAADFQLGAEADGDCLEAALDELRISDIVRSADEIAASFLAGLVITSLVISPDPLELFEGEEKAPELSAFTNAGLQRVPGSAAEWGSSNPAVATVSLDGRVRGLAEGTATIRAIYKSETSQATVNVRKARFHEQDLEVACIERTPKYPRYVADYHAPTVFNDDWLPYQIPVPTGLGGGQTNTTQRWPAAGDTVHFIAHVLNHGKAAVAGFAYAWYFDGQAVTTGTSAKSLALYDTAQVSWQWIWDGQRHRVKFEIQNSDDRPSNNFVEDYTDALAFYSFIERSHDVKFADESVSLPNAIALSEIEWFQLHARRLNAMFAAAGCSTRMRYDRLGMIPDGAAIFPDDPDERLLYDGSFPEIMYAGEETYRTISGYYHAGEDIDYGLLHELGHQLGIIDLYQLNVEAEQNQVTGTSYRTISDLMNGTDHLFSPHSAQAMNQWHGFRRGYFGTYLYDLPQQNRIRMLNAEGQPLAGAQILVFQKITPPGGEPVLPAQPKFGGLTDADGFFTLPNVNIDLASFVRTETGDLPRPNPFGYLSLLGDNGVFLLRIEKDGFCDYQWLDITRFNLAYWQGDTALATHTLTTRLSDQVELFPPPELTESSAVGWSVSTEDQAASALSYDSNRRVLGQNSLRLETNSGSEVTLRYPKDKLGRWDLSRKDSLRVWMYAENPNPGFQNDSPRFRLISTKCDGGYIEYRRPGDVLNDANGRWKYFALPLTGDDDWQRSDSGNISLSEVNALEIRVDTWDSGFILWVDALSFDNFAVPVELEAFTGNAHETKVELHWRTASETNNLGFEIERKMVAPVAAGWQRIGFIAGHGTSTAQQQYSFVEDLAEILFGIATVAYRLKQLDVDGNFDYSLELELTVGAPLAFALHQNYPNPFNAATTIRYQLPVSSHVVLKVVSLLGQEVCRLVNAWAPAGYHHLHWQGQDGDGRKVSTGIYLLVMQAGDYVGQRKLMVLQ